MYNYSLHYVFYSSLFGVLFWLVNTRLLPFLLLGILVYYWYVSLRIKFFFMSYNIIIIIPFIMFSIVLCLGVLFGLVKTRLLPFLLL